MPQDFFCEIPDSGLRRRFLIDILIPRLKGVVKFHAVPQVEFLHPEVEGERQVVEFPAPIQRQIKRKMVSVAFKGNDLVSQVCQTDPETVEIAGALEPYRYELMDVVIVKL